VELVGLLRCPDRLCSRDEAEILGIDCCEFATELTNESCVAAVFTGLLGLAGASRRPRQEIPPATRRFQRRICRGRMRRATVARKAVA